jgi:hypothetical protein
VGQRGDREERVSGALADGHPADIMWLLKPIEPFMADAAAAFDKPLAEMTGRELVSLIAVLGYGVLLGITAGRVAVALVAGAAQNRVAAVRVPLQLR